MNFKDLNINNPLLKALEDLEYIHPTPVQVEAFPVIMSGRDVVGIAQTGTGKTFAYLMPVLRQLKFSEQRHPRVLIIVPTRELVLQVEREVKRLTKYMTVRVGAMYGGSNINTQKSMVFAGLDVLVSTPGRLIDLASIGAIKLTSVQKLIIDEVDEMLEQEFRAQLISIMDYLTGKQQNILFSATLTEEVEKLFTEFFKNPVKVEVAPHGTPLEKIIQSAYHVPNFGTKINLLNHLLKENEDMSKVLVFVSKIKNADKLYEMMYPAHAAGNIGILHSRKPQTQRFEALRRFSENETRILIATDVAARGLDVSDVTHVINFDTPDNPNDYLHRIGRTGRIGKDGTAITFMNPAEEEYLPEIEAVMHKEVPIVELPEEIPYSKVFSDDEKPKLREKNYLKSMKPVDEKGPSFHEKKDKNKKVNMGGAYKKSGGKTRSVNRNVLRNRAKKK